MLLEMATRVKPARHNPKMVMPGLALNLKITSVDLYTGPRSAVRFKILNGDFFSFPFGPIVFRNRVIHYLYYGHCGSVDRDLDCGAQGHRF